MGIQVLGRDSGWRMSEWREYQALGDVTAFLGPAFSRGSSETKYWQIIIEGPA